MNFTYYAFEKDLIYNVTINFKDNSEEDGSYTLKKTNILDFSSTKPEKIQNENKFSDDNDKFFIIDWNGLTKIEIKDKNENIALSISNITEEQSKNLPKEFNNIKFSKIIDSEKTISKPKDKGYSVLMVEPNGQTQLNFNFVKEDDDDDDGNNLAIIILIVLGVIILIIAIFFIFRMIRNRSKEIDFKKKAEDIQNETLLQDI